MQLLKGSGTPVLYIGRTVLNTLNAELNPICHLLALLRAYHILHVSRKRVKCAFWPTYVATIAVTNQGSALGMYRNLFKNVTINFLHVFHNQNVDNSSITMVK